MKGLRTGILLAGAAILSLGPRLVLTFLAADRHQVDEGWTAALLVASGVGTAVVLTAGNIYLAHAAAHLRARHIQVLWLVVLACSGVLAAPLVVAGLKGVKLEDVLVNSPLQWLWSLLAVVATELIAGGCMLADAASQHAAEDRARLLGELEAARADRDAEASRASRAEHQLAELRRQPPPARRVVGPVAVPAEGGAGLRTCPRCEEYEGSEMQVRGHMRACKGPSSAVAAENVIP